ncbi:MAG TPA: FecR domain-containing protein [Asticcacaulis sp.]|nr:FecR domain-containing protein [Asticcacaulis sp.]
MPKIDDVALTWVAKQSAGPLSAIDQEAFATWYAAHPRHQGAYLRAQAIWHSLDKAAIQPNLVPAPKSVRRATNRRNFLMGGMAASVAALVVGGYVAKSLRDRQVLTTAVGEFRKVPLADRSLASLNSGSHVEVNMTPHLRRVVLREGEAWFEVAKNPDAPFVVEAGNIRVRAVGTAFSVRRRDNGADVLVTEGVVEAWSDGGNADRRQISAGEEAFVADDAKVIKVSGTPEEVERKLAWREGNIILDNDTLADAVTEFNRYNTQKIVIADPRLNQTRFVGQYRIDQPEQFADAVHSLLNVPTATDARGIVIGSPSSGPIG